jgi:hypothetical protein
MPARLGGTFGEVLGVEGWRQGSRISGLAAGMHAVLHLPDSVDETDVVDAARERGVGRYGMSGYRYDGSTEPPQLVISFGSTSDSAIRHGIDLVADLLEPQTQRPAGGRTAGRTARQRRGPPMRQSGIRRARGGA